MAERLDSIIKEIGDGDFIKIGEMLYKKKDPIQTCL